LQVNLRGTFRTVRRRVPGNAGFRGGRIVTLTSSSGLSGAFGQAAYATTKIGVLGITRSVAWEGMRFGIKVTALAPAAFGPHRPSKTSPAIGIESAMARCPMNATVRRWPGGSRRIRAEQNLAAQLQQIP
jgi:NAD(P)-dependent dehydrogenase (short-subunit alcohol dehydrogenase family)